MLLVNGIGVGVVPYFADGRHPGRWSEGAMRLLGLTGPVGAAELRRVLQGRDPAGGRFLPARAARRRRPGWDLIFGAPKSVSLLAASSGRGRSVVDAHRAAVEGVMAYADRRLEMSRSAAGGGALRAEGLIAASFDHETNAASVPHLHTHVLVANLSRSSGVWGAVGNADWFVGRSSLAALYQLELRHHLARRGWELEWRLGRDGMADLADLPRSTVRAASTQSRLAVTGRHYEARRMAAAAPSASPPPPAGAAWNDPWRPPRREGGTPSMAAPGGAVTASLDDPALERAVSLRLSVRRSDFRAEDVLVALASCHAGGASTLQASRWVERFCSRSVSVPSPTSGPRWTTPAARRGDEDLVRLLTAGAHRPAGAPVPPRHVDEALDRRPWLSAGEEEVVRSLTGSPAAIQVLGARPGTTALLGQAEILDACRLAWESAGRRVALSSPTQNGQMRWSVLAGLPPYRPGDHPDVLVVDQADRRTTSELARLAEGSRARLVLVEGGTMPRLTNPASHGFVRVADEVGRQSCPAPDPWSTVAALEGPADGKAGSVGRPAAEALLHRWQAAGGAALLVGLGLEEVRALNRAVRTGGRVAAGQDFRPGDRVVVLGRRPGLPRYGTFGTVTHWEEGSQGRRPPVVEVSWADGTGSSISEASVLTALGLGYAVTPGVAARTDAPLMVLGPASVLGRHRGRVVADTGLAPDRPVRVRAAGAGLQR